jgi:adenylate kinase family enzyme
MVGAPGAARARRQRSCRTARHPVASGDLFRDNIKRGTALGKKVKATESGALVPIRCRQMIMTA